MAVETNENKPFFLAFFVSFDLEQDRNELNY